MIAIKSNRTPTNQNASIFRGDCSCQCRGFGDGEIVVEAEGTRSVVIVLCAGRFEFYRFFSNQDEFQCCRCRGRFFCRNSYGTFNVLETRIWEMLRDVNEWYPSVESIVA